MKMPRYKRTEFEDEETSSTNSMQADNLIAVGNETALYREAPGANHSVGIGGVPELRYQGRKRNFWQRASPLERILMIVVVALLFIISILSILLDVRSGPQSLSVVEISAANITGPIGDRRKEVVVPNYCLTPQCLTVASAIINAIDPEIDPCKDFYQYSCGGWIKRNPLPDGESIWGTFHKLGQENQIVMKNVLENEGTKVESEAEAKARIYYQSCLDKNETMEELGSEPLVDLLKKVGGWNISGEYYNWTFMESLKILNNKFNRGALFTWAVGEDKKNSSFNVLQIDQGGLILPSRDYYLNKSSDDEVLSAYLSYMTQVGILLGGEENSTRQQMEDVIQFEKRLANITTPDDQRLDDQHMYNKMTIGEVEEISPTIEWLSYFNYGFEQIGKKLKKDHKVVVYAPDFLNSLSSLLDEYISDPQKKIVLSNYLGWSLVHSLTTCLSKPFREASKILRKALIGSEGGETPWRYCVTDTNNVIGFALGAMFVREVFHGKSKLAAEKMIDEVRDAFKENLPQLKWMDAETREKAKEKADAITDMIGFPDYIMNPKELDKRYKGLNFTADAYFENNVRVNQFSLIRNMKRLYKLANKTEWEMTPPTVNAYYTPTKNNMVFPAGILQAPFYDPHYPKSLNFGAMGVVMGHELTHAFDDEGREYDKEGNLNQWWKNSTIKSFQDETQCFVDQYSNYDINTEHVNGKQTLGENIADNGGLKAAFHAYEYWMNHHDPESILPGVNLTHRQLFFIGFSQVWCSTSTPEASHLRILKDPHSPPQFRVIGTLSNSFDFAREFKCKQGDPMNPIKKCDIW